MDMFPTFKDKTRKTYAGMMYADDNNLRSQYQNVLSEMIANFEVWSWTNEELLFFHEHKTGCEWRAYDMLRFHETVSQNLYSDN